MTAQNTRIEATAVTSIEEFARSCTLLTDASVVDLHDNQAVTDDWLILLAELGLHPETLILSGTRISDKGIARLARMPQRHLTAIYMARTGVTGSGLGHLLAFPDLKTVFVTDNGIADNDPTVVVLRQHTQEHFRGVCPGEYEGVVTDWSRYRPLSAMY